MVQEGKQSLRNCIVATNFGRVLRIQEYFIHPVINKYQLILITGMFTKDNFIQYNKVSGD